MERVETLAAELETVTVSLGEEVEDVATITLDRPESHNALNGQLRDEVSELLDVLQTSNAKVIVLTGSAETGSFAAGADLRELRDRTPRLQRERARRPRIYDRVANVRQPVIARINGHALGGGCELALASDVRIAHNEAKFGLPEISLGLIPGGGGTQRLPRLVGEGTAMRLILTGETISAAEAFDIGLIDELCSSEDLDDRVYGLARSIAKHSTFALELAKKAVSASSRMDLENGIDYEAELFAQAFNSEDGSEGIAAFLEEREPGWKGR